MVHQTYKIIFIVALMLLASTDLSSFNTIYYDITHVRHHRLINIRENLDANIWIYGFVFGLNLLICLFVFFNELVINPEITYMFLWWHIFEALLTEKGTKVLFCKKQRLFHASLPLMPWALVYSPVLFGRSFPLQKAYLLDAELRDGIFSADKPTQETRACF